MSELTYSRLFKTLNASQCRYVVVGGLAIILHGHTRLTTDTDLVVDLAAEELFALLQALENLGFQPRAPVNLKRFADPVAREKWQREKGMQVFSLFHPDQPRWVIDLFVESPIDFETLSTRSIEKTIEAVEVRVASIDGLIAMKRIADHEIDRADIRSLQQIKEVSGEYRV